MAYETYKYFCSVQLTLVGISFSIFTILYSLVLGKLELLRNIATQIKQGNKNPELKQSEHFCLKYIHRLKRMNRWTIIICTVSILLLILMSIIKDATHSDWIFYTICIANWIDFAGILVVIISVFISYFKDTKFD